MSFSPVAVTWKKFPIFEILFSKNKSGNQDDILNYLKKVNLPQLDQDEN